LGEDGEVDKRAYGRLSMPWQDMEICSRCAERRGMVAALVTVLKWFVDVASSRALAVMVG
jgi:sulfur relay (sulfurtransferase) complex TusBCD TusD component (DsrE family)